jgi:hypothetical protein
MLLALLLALGTSEPGSTVGAAPHAAVERPSQTERWFSLLADPAGGVRAFALVAPRGGRADVGASGFKKGTSTTDVVCAARFLTVSPTVDKAILSRLGRPPVDPGMRGDVSACLH